MFTLASSGPDLVDMGLLELKARRKPCSMLAVATPVDIVSLPGGVVMTFIRAPLRASGETPGPAFQIGWRRCHDVIPLLEGAILLARDVPVLELKMFDVLLSWSAPLVLGLVVVSFPLFGLSTPSLYAPDTMFMPSCVHGMCCTL